MPPTSSRTENGGDALTSPVSFQLEQPPWGDSTETNGRKAQVKSAENGSLEVPTNPQGISLFLATVFVVGGVAGIGILALPYSIVETGWVGLFLIIASAFASGYSGWKLGACWTILEERWVEYRAHVRDPYPSIAFRAYGKWAKLFTSTVQIMGLFGYGSVFILLSAELVMDVMRQFFGEKVTLTFCYWLIIISAAMGVLMLLGTPKDFGFAAFGAMGATAAAFLIVVGVCCARMHDGRAAFPRHPPHIGLAMFFRGFGTIMFSYGGAAMFPTIQNDMRDRSRFPMAVAYATIALVGLYVVMATLGYLTFGNEVGANILMSIGDGGVSIAVQLLFIVHLITGFLIIINPMCQEVEGHIGIPTEFTWKRVVMRAAIMLALLFTTETVPHFGKVLPLVGSFMVGLTTFILPCLFYYKLCSEKSPEWKERTIPTWEKVVILVILVAGLIGTIAGTCASIEDLVKPGAFALPCFIDPNVKP
uniref:Solute carrier family 32 (Vesicular inhibitory amino acid transporter) n=1 Tax=Rhipicephalus appendiculatus TaxID=34631 RepID=A0A131YWW9_RHIAP